MRYPDHLHTLIDVLKKLPGVGNKSAERFAFHLLNREATELEEMALALKEIPEKLKLCEECGCLKGLKECSFCEPRRAASKLICVIASPKDAFAIEGTSEFKGLYHVLGNLLSPMDGFLVEQLKIEKLKRRIADHKIEEIVIALDSTLEGDATSLFLKNELSSLSVNISRLAFGLPMGSSLDYVDGGTLARAFAGRGLF